MKTPEGEMLRLSEVLGIPVQEIREGLDSNRLLRLSVETRRVRRGQGVSFYLSEHADDFPGVEVVPAAVRDYPNGTMAAHVLGVVGQIDRGEHRRHKRFKDYGPNDLVGQTGLEQQYERFLQGQKGRQKYLVNANQEIVRLLGRGGRRPGQRPRAVARHRHAARSRSRPSFDGIEHTRTHLRRLAGPAGLPQGERPER